MIKILTRHKFLILLNDFLEGFDISPDDKATDSIDWNVKLARQRQDQNFLKIIDNE